MWQNAPNTRILFTFDNNAGGLFDVAQSADGYACVVLGLFDGFQLKYILAHRRRIGIFEYLGITQIKFMLFFLMYAHFLTLVASVLAALDNQRPRT
jgi:hypothetical protein